MMSFGLLTCLTPTDVPKMLARCAQGYRGNQDPFPDAWKLCADELSKLAHELVPKIEEAMKNQKRPRAKL